MLDELLELTARQGKILGLRVRPPTPDGFEVHVWIGPRMGDRMEWYERFPVDMSPMDGIERVAELALDYCRRHGDCAGIKTQPTEATPAYG